MAFVEQIAAKKPHVLEISLEAERGAAFPCPDCGKPCKTHDFKTFTWRHLNFFQHHCMITAGVPRTVCPEHGVKRATVPWAREGSGFTLLFEQAAMVLVREMPVLAAARIIAITDKRLWRIVEHYVAKALEGLVLSGLTAVAFDETSSKKGHNYVTVFIEADREREPVVFATPGKGKATVAQFRGFLKAHGGEPGRIVELVCDMSPAFLAAVVEALTGVHARAGYRAAKDYTSETPTLRGESGPSRRGHGTSRSNGAGNMDGRAMASTRAGLARS